MPKHLLKAGVIPAIFLPACLFFYTVRPAFAEQRSLPVSIYATQSRLGVPLSQIGGSVTVLTEENIKASGALTAADALRHVPGVVVNQSGGPGSLTQIRVRGSEANHVLLIVDGVRYNDASGFGFDYSGILAADIERIEILRGPQSGIYGSDAHSGVIAITTKSGRGLSKPIIEAFAEGGSFGTASGSVFAGIGNGKLWSSLSASGLTTDGFNVATTGTEKDAARGIL